MASGDEAYGLAIDLGTTRPKVALVLRHGRIVDHAFEEVPLLLVPSVGGEQLPDDWWAPVWMDSFCPGPRNGAVLCRPSGSGCRQESEQAPRFGQPYFVDGQFVVSSPIVI